MAGQMDGDSLKVEIAKNSGFCFGVKKAIDTTMSVIEEKSVVSSLGPLIHNQQVVDVLDKKGLSVVQEPEEAKGSLVIRSHGVPLEIYERARKSDIDVVDCTCPFVRKVQKKAESCFKAGKKVIIIGDASHPEVKGINGWCGGEAYIIGSLEDVSKLPELDEVCIVAQTTMRNELFEQLSEAIAKKSKAAEIYNTICSATRERQDSCVDLAKRADAMIVIGGKNSSNTRKLVEISEKYCENVFFIETADEIDTEKFEKYDLVGITAGASTPDWIIEEVFNKMNNINDKSEMERALEESFVSIRRGDIIEGEVIMVTSSEVIVNIGYMADGIISKEEYSNDSDVDLKAEVKEGDKITVMVVNTNDGDGNVVLSKKRAAMKSSWKDVEALYENKNIISVKVTEVKDNGLVVDVLGIRGFIPLSQVSVKFVKDLSEYRDAELNARIIDLDSRKNRLVLSSKQVEEENVKAKRDDVWSTINEGQVVTGVVDKVMGYGAFIDLGEGVTGLLHVSDMAWTRVNDPKAVVSEGESVKVVIQSVDRDANRISLGMKQLKPQPWDQVSDAVKVGDIIEGSVKKLMPFGAFVEVIEGVEGLVHISQIAYENIAKPSDVLSVDQVVKVKVLSMDLENRRIELSIKEVEGKKPETKEKSSQPREEKIDLSQYNEDTEFTIGDLVDLEKLK